MEKAEGLRSTNWQLQNSGGEVKYSPGNVVRIYCSNCVMPLGCRNYWGTLCKVLSQHCAVRLKPIQSNIESKQ